jgi:hypothetical protein
MSCRFVTCALFAQRIKVVVTSVAGRDTSTTTNTITRDKHNHSTQRQRQTQKCLNSGIDVQTLFEHTCLNMFEHIAHLCFSQPRQSLSMCVISLKFTIEFSEIAATTVHFTIKIVDSILEEILLAF